jgi:spermidine synthase
VWSAGDDPSFTARLRRAGLEARAHPVRAHVRGGRGRGARHVIFVGER